MSGFEIDASGGAPDAGIAGTNAWPHVGSQAQSTKGIHMHPFIGQGTLLPPANPDPR